ncbi:colorectal mutant cancer protein isoform X2 [Polyodon spathula]|uniref:colorectal mutant cancer protein isoform X2 n=1 Tax=Polyodon spathula TaxID=7913 RepID=UPI001B7E7D39|nr:colorectal mutant cancer protein isoform X2 [Polyodon spathula]
MDSADAGDLEAASGEDCLAVHGIGEPPKCKQDPQDAGSDPPGQDLLEYEQDIGSLLRMVAELNGNIGGLQGPPSAKEADAIPLKEMPGVQSPEPQCSSLEDGEPQSSTLTPGQGDNTELWMEVQRLLDVLESSINSRRARAVPCTFRDSDSHIEHLTAAWETWVHVTQVLDDVETELGIPSDMGLPPEERSCLQREVLASRQGNRDLRTTLQQREQEIHRSKVMLSSLQEERDRLKKKVIALQCSLQAVGSASPPPNPSSSSGIMSPPCLSSPPCPGSPVPHPAPALSSGGDRPTPATSRVLVFENGIERLHRCIERLRSRNDRLSAALERRKGESERLSMLLGKHESSNTALQLALRYSEDSVDAYSELWSLCEARRPALLETRGAAEPTACPYSAERSPETGESPHSAAEGAMEQTLAAHSRGDHEGALRERILQLRKDLEAVQIPVLEPGAGETGGKDTDTLPGHRDPKPGNSPSPKRGKTALLQELGSVREEMAELREEIRLAEKERRCLEWTLAAHKTQETASGLILESLQAELEEEEAGIQIPPEWAAPAAPSVGVPGSQNESILREIQAALGRELALSKRVSALRCSLEVVLTDSATRRRHSKEISAQLAREHSSATAAFRSSRMKYREQLWRLERQIVVMSQRHSAQIGGLQGALQALEYRRAETTL